MPSIGLVIAEYVCPTIGAILSTLTFSAPIKSLKSCIKNGSLGNLNPTPWAFMTGNTIGWLAYSYITLNLFVFFANAPGLLISIWLNVGAMKLQYYEEIIKNSTIQSTEGESGDHHGASAEEEHENNEVHSSNNGETNNESGGNSISCHNPPSSLTTHESKVLQIVIIWMGILSITSLIPVDKEYMTFVVGVAVNLNLIFFYAAPLSTIMTVLRTKSSSSIHFGTMVMNTLNSFFWCIYSFAIQDFYIFIPNGLGFLAGLLQIAFYMIYPQREIIEGDDTEEYLQVDGMSTDGGGEINNIIL